MEGTKAGVAILNNTVPEDLNTEEKVFPIQQFTPEQISQKDFIQSNMTRPESEEQIDGFNSSEGILRAKKIK